MLSQKSGRGEQILGKNVRGKGGGVERAGGGARFDELRRKVKIPTNGVGPHA